MATTQQQKDVLVKYDDLGRIISVDQYAMALDIKNSDTNWKYIVTYVDYNIVHYAELLGDDKLDVRGAQEVQQFRPFCAYNVYFELKLEEGAVGFEQPVIFTFTNQEGAITTTARKLQTGTNMITVGNFVFTPSDNTTVSARMNDLGTYLEKKGLVVCRIGITLANC